MAELLNIHFGFSCCTSHNTKEGKSSNVLRGAMDAFDKLRFFGNDFTIKDLINKLGAAGNDQDIL